MIDREAAWFALHDALLVGWMLGQTTYDPMRQAWTITAMSKRPRGRQAKSEFATSGTGSTEIEAVRDLTEKLVAYSL